MFERIGMSARTLPNRDAHGRTICCGMRDRILTIPDWLTHDLPPDEVLVLRRLEGEIKRVVEIDASGYVWFSAEDSGDPWFRLHLEEVLVTAQGGSNVL
jgi:hypothetical protein